MATYIPGLTDSIPELPLYQPNIGFFNQMLQKKASQYEQGYAQVKSAYDSILNAPLTDQGNVTTRDEYVKSAQEKLKNLSSSDLSLPQNVDAANNVFAPFWEDDMLLMDTAFTKYTQSEIQKGLRLRDSKVKEDRDQYSEIAMQYLTNSLDPLKSANRNPDAYKNLEKRRFTPFINEKEYWNTQAKNMNFEINWSDPSGPYLINTKNGQRAEQSFRAFAEGMISPQLENQYKVIGTVEKEGRVKQVKSMFPGVTDNQALEYIAKDVLTDVRKNYKTALDGLKSESASTQSKIDEFKKLGELTPAQQNRYNELRDYQDNLNEKLTLKAKEFAEVSEDSSKNALELHDNIISNPDYYFTKLARTRSINNWAAAASANQSRKVEINPVWKEQNDLFYQQEQLKLSERQQNREDAKFAWEQTLPRKGTETSTTAGGYTDPVTGEYTPSKGELDRATVLGSGSTDVTKTGTAYEMFTQRQAQRLAVADESIFSKEGLGRIAAQLPGADLNKVIKYFSAVKRGVNNPNAMTPDEREAKQVIDKALKEKTGITVTGPGNLRNALIAYSQDYFKDKTKDGGVGMSPEDITSLLKYNFGAQARQEYISLENKKDELIKKQILDVKDSKFAPLLRDGEILTKTSYMKSLFGGTDKNKFINGATENYRSIDAGPMGAQVSTGTVDSPIDRAERWDNAEKRYDVLMKEINSKVVPNLPEYNNQTGKMGVNFEYQLDGKITKGGTEKGTRLVQEITQASNRDQIFVDGELSDDEEINKVITELGSMGEKDLEKYFSNVIYKTVGTNGKPSLELKFAPIKSSDKTEVAGVDLNKLVGKSVEITISPNAQGPTINALPNNEGNYIYGSLLKGKDLKSDPLMEAANFSYHIQPDNTTNPTKAYVSISRKTYNTKTGRYEDAKPIETTIDFFGANKKTPDELMAELYSMFQMHLTQNRTNEEVYKKQNVQTTKSVAQLEQERQQARVGY